MARLKFGDRHTSNSGLGFWVVEMSGWDNVVIEFDLSKWRTTTRSDHIKNGCVRDNLSPGVFGVGFVGEGGSVVSSGGKITKKYSVWKAMISRCYSRKYQLQQPTYRGCLVCEAWLNFQIFGLWFDDNYIEGFHLDKDMLGDGKLYSPETCKFTSQAENTAYSKAKSYTVVSPVGVTVELHNLSKFCRDNQLNVSHMSAVCSGKRRHHKGWSAGNTRE